MYLNEVIVSEEYLFIYQDRNSLVNYTSSLLIFDRTNFTPLKKFDLNNNTYLSINYFYVNQKYYIFGVSESQVQMLTIDNSLNYTSVSKVFESSRVNSSNNFLRVALHNNMFILAETGPMRGSQNSTISNIIFHKASLDFESGSWEFLNTNNGEAFTTGFPSTALSTGFIFNNSNIVKIWIVN